MDTNAIGLDIGGANLKLATAAGAAQSRPFALWKHPEKLAAELRDFTAGMPADIPVGVTMTGELCDCFRTKREGVRHIVEATEEALLGRDILYWTTEGQFVDAEAACEHPITVAAANWHAQATFVGRYVPEGFGILIDMGSTTTDVIPLGDGIPRPLRRTDAGRLQTGELLYFGARRTPLCALIPDGCAEHFATIHDVHVLTGTLPEEPNNTETADGRPMTREFAWERIARMIGHDRETVDADVSVRRACRESIYRQKARLTRAIKGLGMTMCGRNGTVVISGSGSFMTAQWVAENMPKSKQIRLDKLLGDRLSEAACAYAVAVLRAERFR